MASPEQSLMSSGSDESPKDSDSGSPTSSKEGSGDTPLGGSSMEERPSRFRPPSPTLSPSAPQTKRARVKSVEEVEKRKEQRLLKNRQSAAASRQRKKEYIGTLQKQVTKQNVENTSFRDQVHRLIHLNWESKLHIERLEKRIIELFHEIADLRGKLKDYGVSPEEKFRSLSEALPPLPPSLALHDMAELVTSLAADPHLDGGKDLQVPKEYPANPSANMSAIQALTAAAQLGAGLTPLQAQAMFMNSLPSSGLQGMLAQGNLLAGLNGSGLSNAAAFNSALGANVAGGLHGGLGAVINEAMNGMKSAMALVGLQNGNTAHAASMHLNGGGNGHAHLSAHHNGGANGGGSAGYNMNGNGSSLSSPRSQNHTLAHNHTQDTQQYSEA